MILNFRLLAILPLIFVFLSCDDSLDEVYQDADQILRSRLIESIKVDPSEGSIEDYKFNYNENITLESFNTSESEIINLEYNENGELTNSDEVIENIFYIDDILQIPYSYKSIDMYIDQKNEQGDPTKIKMYLTKEGETRPVSVEITYDSAPNIYRPYLVAGGILAAADKEEPTAGRMLYFTSEYVPKHNLSSVTYINQEAKEEHIFVLTNEYNNKKLVTKTDITHFDVSEPGSSPKTETTTLLYSYVRD